MFFLVFCTELTAVFALEKYLLVVLEWFIDKVCNGCKLNDECNDVAVGPEQLPGKQV